ncbi:metal-dependent transcriptional regulator [Candidatus Sumerlaeota bacterium]|nr:metal-dependent transcriptional regulator [Candidatus Sumerlaeota bacterium]
MTNDSEYWRKYEEAKVTHSAAHYLMAIINLRKQQGYARITDVADYLRVSRGAASKAIALLREREYICEDPNRMLELTRKGFNVTHAVERNFAVVECFFKDILKIEETIARENACKLEHLLSPSVTESLFRFVRALEENPALMDQIRRKIDTDDNPCVDKTGCMVCNEYDGCLDADLQDMSRTDTGSAE